MGITTRYAIHTTREVNPANFSKVFGEKTLSPLHILEPVIDLNRTSLYADFLEDTYKLFGINPVDFVEAFDVVTQKKHLL